MVRGYVTAAALLLCGMLAAPVTGAERGQAALLFTNILNDPKGCPLNQAFAGLWLDQDRAAANARLEQAWLEALGEHDNLTPEVADKQFKWQMRTWVRLYYLFGPGSAHFPGRLSAENAARIESLFWNYACDKSLLSRADLRYVWFIQGSENHDMMDLGNAFLASQALVEHPDFAERMLPDGGTLREHTSAWTAYFTHYCEERVRRGLLIEFASPTYGKYYVPELVNLFDFAQDPELRARVEAYLHLIWADWAQEQLNGVRGGAKARCYQGKYSRRGESDSWFLMGQVLLGTGDWARPGDYNNAILGYGPILVTSAYSLPPVIDDLARSPEERGDYVYLSRRPGRMAHVSPVPPRDDQSCWYHLARDDSRFVRYTWCTPHHILGSYALDPALREDFQILADEPERAAGTYAAITVQNLWQGVIFDTHPDARIFPQCFAKPDKAKPEVSVTFTQQVAVQHENVMLVQANRANPAITAFRIYFGPGMKPRLEEHDGWRVLEEGESFAGVRFFSRSRADETAGATWEDEHFLKVGDVYAPAAIITGQRSRFADRAAFVDYLRSHTVSVDGGKLRYAFVDRSGERVTLGMSLDRAERPEKNDRPLNLAPESYYDSPFMRQDASGEVTITFRGKSLAVRAGNP